MTAEICDLDIIVNAQHKVWHARVIDYAQVVELAVPSAHDRDGITVTYTHGPEGNREGDLVEGQNAPCGDGMVFDVTRTDKS